MGHHSLHLDVVRSRSEFLSHDMTGEQVVNIV